MAEDTDLDAELDALLLESSYKCRYAKTVPAEIKAVIRKRYEGKDGKQLTAWVAFSALCRKHGVEVSPDSVRHHFTGGHADDR